MLNDSQKRSVSATIRLLEKNLHTMEQLLRSDDYIGIVDELNNDLPVSVRDELSTLMTRIMDKIRFFAEHFALERQKRQVSNQLFALLTYNWTMLEEIKTRRLKGYGAVADGLQQTLDSELDAIIVLILDMQKTLRESPDQVE
jgi:hypothetical protein